VIFSEGVPFDDMQIRAANAADLHAHKYLAGPGSGFGSSRLREDWFQLLQVRGENRLSSSALNPVFLRTPGRQPTHVLKKTYTKPRGKKGGFSRNWFPELAHELAFRAPRLYAELLMNNLTPETLMVGFISYIVFLFSTTCHEASHALAAKIGGDSTAAMAGRLV